MRPFEQDVHTAPGINQDAVNQAVSYLYCDHHRIIMGLDCIVDIFLCENNLCGTRWFLGTPTDSEYTMTGSEPRDLPSMVLSCIVGDPGQGRVPTDGMNDLDLLHQIFPLILPPLFYFPHLSLYLLSYLDAISYLLQKFS